MKFKSKRHLVLTLKKKSGVALSDAEVKELLGIEGTTEKADDKKPEDKEKEEAAKKAADEAAKKEEEDKKKPAPEKKDGEADPAATSLSMEDLGKAIAQIQENLNMLMEAMATMMDAPAEEAKVDPAKEDEKKEDEVEDKEEEKSDDEDEDEDMTEEQMEKELEKTIADLEAIENA